MELVVPRIPRAALKGRTDKLRTKDPRSVEDEDPGPGHAHLSLRWQRRNPDKDLLKAHSSRSTAKFYLSDGG